MRLTHDGASSPRGLVSLTFPVLGKCRDYLALELAFDFKKSCCQGSELGPIGLSCWKTLPLIQGKRSLTPTVKNED